MPWVPKKDMSIPTVADLVSVAKRSLEGTQSAKAHAQRAMDVISEIRNDLTAMRKNPSVHILKNIHRRVMEIEELMRLIKNDPNNS